MIKRYYYNKTINQLLNNFKVVSLIGPRQCGKTTLAKMLKFDYYYDLENPRDFQKLENPLLSLEKLEGLIVIDESQKKPDLFSLLRFLVDSYKNQKYLILGSSSPELVKGVSESLAGRVANVYLSPFLLCELGEDNIDQVWIRGGFPSSYLASNDENSFIWRDNFIQSFLEKDLSFLDIRTPSNTLRRFWTMLAHYHGQILNYSELARSFGLAENTVKHYIQILEQTFMIRLLLPWHNNTKKRLVKSPKLYIRDSGIFHSLMNLENKDDLFSNPKLGASWEGFCIEQIIDAVSSNQRDVYFWSTHSGAELDILFFKNGKNYGVEIKFSDAPKLTKSMQVCKKDLDLEKLWVISPNADHTVLCSGIENVSLSYFIKLFKNF